MKIDRLTVYEGGLRSSRGYYMLQIMLLEVMCHSNLKLAYIGNEKALNRIREMIKADREIYDNFEVCPDEITYKYLPTNSTISLRID